MNRLLVKLSEMGLHYLIPFVSYLYHGYKTGYVLKNEFHLHWDAVFTLSICLALFLSMILRNQLEGKKAFIFIGYFIHLVFILLIVSEYYVIGTPISVIIVVQIFSSIFGYIALEAYFHYSNKAFLNNKKSN